MLLPTYWHPTQNAPENAAFKYVRVVGEYVIAKIA
jgi:hypothetical protein